LPGGPWTYDEFLQDVYAPDGVGVQLIAGNVKSHIGKAIASIPAMVERIATLELALKLAQSDVYKDAVLDGLRAQNAELIDLIKGMDAEGDIDATTIASLRAQNAELRAALKEAIDVVKIFHGPPAWDIYESRAPEMQRWKAALAKSQEPSCEPQS